MATRDLTMAPTPSRADHFRQVERDVWNRAGLDPIERYVELDSPQLRLRLLEVGTGEPLLFVHGTAGPGAWPSLIRELQGFRCLILDRPGWGMSDVLDFSKHEYGTLVATVLAGVLAGLGIERAGVIGNSIGNVWALRFAERHPSQVSRVVLLGGGPLVDQVAVPGIIRVIASPIGALMVRLPDNPSRVRSILQHGGHGASIESGQLDDFITWRLALGRHTKSMRNERAMIRTIVEGNAWRPGLTFDDDELSAIRQPTLVVYGTADPVGTSEVWRRVTGLLPGGQLQIVDNGSHEPWVEDPRMIGRSIDGFMSAALVP